MLRHFLLAGVITRVFIFQKIAVRRAVGTVRTAILTKKRYCAPHFFWGGGSSGFAELVFLPFLPFFIFFVFFVVVVVARFFLVEFASFDCLAFEDQLGSRPLRGDMTIQVEFVPPRLWEGPFQEDDELQFGNF